MSAAIDAGSDARAAFDDDSVAESDARRRVHVDVRRGDPTPEELAAVVAVVTETYQSESDAAVADESAGISAWQISARALRQPLRRDLGWGRFTG